MKFKAAIFDLDGTLLDTLADIANCMNEILQNAGYPTHPTEDYKYFIGEGLEALVRKTLPEDKRTDENIQKYFVEIKKIYHDRWDETSIPYDGIKELLTEMEKLNLPIAVLSNKAHEFTNIMIQTLLKEFNFSIIQGALEDKPKKPDPTLAIEMAEKMNIKPEEVIYIGDTSIDMQTAKNAGFYSVGVLWGFRKKEELVEHGAQELVEHPMDILALLK